MILSGIAVLSGSSKDQRGEGVTFFIATLGAALWSLSVGVVYSLSSNTVEGSLIALAIVGVYAGSLLMDVALLAYAGWWSKIGKFLSAVAAVVAIFLVGALLADQAFLTSVTSMTSAFEQLYGQWYFRIYTAFFAIVTMFIIAFLMARIMRATQKKVRIGYAIFLVGFVITGAASLIFDIILLTVRPDLVWVGPLTLSASIIAFYYAILRYRILSLAASWLKVLSYIIIMASAAIVYMLIFYAVFIALFGTASPSTPVIVLNFVMIVIMLLLMPVVNELTMFMRSLVSVHQIDISYVVKKLNRLAGEDVDLTELAGFLADHLHFTYIGFLINGRLYGSSSLPLTATELNEIAHLAPAKKDIWQDFNVPVSKVCKEQDLNAIAELRGGKDKVFGQMLVGKPLGKTNFEQRDLIQIEMIINLVAAIIGSSDLKPKTKNLKAKNKR